MATRRLSQQSYLKLAATAFATIWLGFGVNALVRPTNALEIFEFDPPASAADKKLVDSLILLYGVRDLFMGLAVYAAAYFGNHKTLGWILIAGSGVAYVDGFVVKAQIGRGEWNHWGYAPALTVVGSLLAGIMDRF